MSTMDRAKLSKKNSYRLPPHRYRELRHHCLQYSDWRELYRYLILPESHSIVKLSGEGYITSPVEDVVLLREMYLERVELIEEVVRLTDADIFDLLLIGVTREVPYEYLAARGLFMSRSAYYARYHKFFWLLDREITSREMQVL